MKCDCGAAACGSPMHSSWCSTEKPTMISTEHDYKSCHGNAIMVMTEDSYVHYAEELHLNSCSCIGTIRFGLSTPYGLNYIEEIQIADKTGKVLEYLYEIDLFNFNGIQGGFTAKNRETVIK